MGSLDRCTGKIGMRIFSTIAGTFLVAAMLAQTHSAQAQPARPEPSLALTKTADRQTYSQVGEVVTYTYVITNDGDVPLGGLTLTDDRIPATGISCNFPVSLNQMQSTKCTGTYVITAADISAGRVTNRARVEGFDEFVSLEGPGSRIRYASASSTAPLSLVERILSQLNPIGTA
ncbi:MAG: hypothetical protein AAF405_07085, partial [Pseudomonadota bacterium]